MLLHSPKLALSSLKSVTKQPLPILTPQISPSLDLAMYVN